MGSLPQIQFNFMVLWNGRQLTLYIDDIQRDHDLLSFVMIYDEVVPPQIQNIDNSRSRYCKLAKSK